MNVEKLPSGSYRITQKYNNKRYRVTVDHKPTPKEALQLMAEVMDGCEVKGSFKAAAREYIESKRNILSPKTVKEYEGSIERLPEWFNKLPVARIDRDEVQRCVNELAMSLSPKTVRNYHGFISAVLAKAKPGLMLRTTLPKLQKKEPYIPKKEDLRAILKEVKGTMFEIPIELACWGLRRGEICALELSDLDNDNVIHITKDLVQNSAREWVVKPPKTPTSVRDVQIDQDLADRIRKQGYIYKGHPGSINKNLERIQRKLNIETFSLHKLRHWFISRLLDKGYDLKTVQDLVGHAGPQTIQRVYSQSIKLKDEETRKQIARDIRDFLS